jgi:hypothetical protein
VAIVAILEAFSEASKAEIANLGKTKASESNPVVYHQELPYRHDYPCYCVDCDDIPPKTGDEL